jgi:8-oxo-dGTP pyrophosphatase MutT (NUDIX family)
VTSPSFEVYQAGLNRKTMSAGWLFRDGAGRALLVEPSYKPVWEIPGGSVEAEESPWVAAERELAEELGWQRRAARLLVIDHVPTRPATAERPERIESVAYVFDGGVVSEADVARLSFPDGELLSAALCTPAEVLGRTRPLLAARVALANRAVEHGTLVLAESGQVIHPIE